MRVCIVGAGAIGGFLGTLLAQAGDAQVSALARGAALTSLREHGWQLYMEDRLIQVPVIASDDAQALGEHDLVIVAVKGQALPALASAIRPLLGPDSVVLPAMNGVPWWFCRHLAEFADTPLLSVDPGGVVSAAIPIKTVVGCVIHASSTCPAPGIVRHVMGRGLIIGEPGGGVSERVKRIATLLGRAGLEVTGSADIRYDIWYKLWGNLTMNPVSALTGATIDRLLDDPLVRAFCSAAMQEAATIGHRIGCPVSQSPEDRHTVTRKLGAFKTSMLQDAEAGRTLELDSIVGAVREIGQRLKLATPNIDALLGLTRLFARVHELYPA